MQKNCTSGQVGGLAEHCFCILGSGAAVAGLLITFCVALFCIGHQHRIPATARFRQQKMQKAGQWRVVGGLLARQDLIRR